MPPLLRGSLTSSVSTHFDHTEHVFTPICTEEAYADTLRLPHTLPDGGGAVVMSGVTTGNAITAQTE